jgi:UDP-N-acetylglucosamine 3-dehydrogenase
MGLQVLIVGCGAVIHHIYKVPLQRLASQGELVVTGLVDPNAGNRAGIRDAFPGAREFACIEEALDACPPQLTIVSTPATMHAEQTILALKKGSHVLCEKPMASTPEECRRMVEEAHVSGLILGIEMTRRFSPNLARLKSMIDAGELGRPLSFSYREGGRYAWPVMSGASFRRERGGGGVLADKGSHALDSMRWLFGPYTVVSYEDDAMKGGVEANCVMHIKGADAEGLIRLSWDQDLRNEFRVIGARREAVLNPISLEDIRVVEEGRSCRIEPGISFPAGAGSDSAGRGTPRGYDECVYYLLVQMLRAIRLGERVPVSGEEGAWVVSAISDCYGMAAPMAMPWLSPKENAAYRLMHWRNEP